MGELRGRGSRMHEFADLAEVESVLQALAQRESGAAVCKLPRQPGRKESRYAHLLAGQPDMAQMETAEAPEEPVRREVRAENERLSALETSVGEVRQQLADLQRQFEEFKRQFE